VGQVQPGAEQAASASGISVGSNRALITVRIAGTSFAIGATYFQHGVGCRQPNTYRFLGLVLVLLGGFIMFFSLVVETPDGGVIGDIAWRPLVCILGANLLFGALLGGMPSIGLPSFGLVVAIFALTGVALLADAASFNLRRMLVLSSILAGGSYLVFIYLLNLQLPVWPAFVSGS
jgi:hypothetical protein